MVNFADEIGAETNGLSSFRTTSSVGVNEKGRLRGLRWE
jgi:hypothetical protein